MTEISELLDDLYDLEAHKELPPILRYGNGKRHCTGHTPESDNWWEDDVNSRIKDALERAAYDMDRASNARSMGAKARAAKARADNEWMRPIFDQAYSQLEADGSKQRGHTKLLLVTLRIVGTGHPDHHRRGDIKDRHARAYLANRRAEKKSGTFA
jgi:hypothetical protein